MSDGIIGDERHQHEPGGSDHNPDPRGIVHALDLTHDPTHGVDCTKLAAVLRSRQDPRVRYVIWDRRIFLGLWSDQVMARRRRPWRWAAYTGVDPHTSHLHVSVGYDQTAEDDISPWWTTAAPTDTPGGDDWMAASADDVLAALVKIDGKLDVIRTKLEAGYNQANTHNGAQVKAAQATTAAVVQVGAEIGSLAEALTVQQKDV